MDEKELAKKIYEIGESIDENVIAEASNEELMGYLFLAEKMKRKIKQLSDLK